MIERKRFTAHGVPVELWEHEPKPEGVRIGKLAYDMRAATAESWLEIAQALGVTKILAYRHATRHARREKLPWPPGGHVFPQSYKRMHRHLKGVRPPNLSLPSKRRQRIIASRNKKLAK